MTQIERISDALGISYTWLMLFLTAFWSYYSLCVKLANTGEFCVAYNLIHKPKTLINEKARQDNDTSIFETS